MQDTRRLEPSAPRGRLAVRVPLDAPIGEPLPGLIALGVSEAAEEPVTGEWRLSRAAGDPLPATATLRDLGLAEDSALVLRRPGALDSQPTAAVPSRAWRTDDHCVRERAASCPPG